jgi:hypothetical protein
MTSISSRTERAIDGKEKDAGGSCHDPFTVWQLLLVTVTGVSVRAEVGDPQVRTDHPYAIDIPNSNFSALRIVFVVGSRMAGIVQPSPFNLRNL